MRGQDSGLYVHGPRIKPVIRWLHRKIDSEFSGRCTTVIGSLQLGK
ncbi:hypothetical protein PDR5_23170 [Pseudomonas sp. DR 5-09]|nr:hypothetical protein PDR5_23170 [Pseudomonas sp. DR 5-09]